jgi:AraC-like DNA-binding protein
MTSPRPEEPHLPAVHALHLAEIVRRYGHAPAELYAAIGASAEALAVPDARLGVSEVEALVARARALTGEDALGVQLGFQMRVSAHGYLGFAAMTAPTVREALAAAIRFAPTRTNALALALHEKASLASLVLEERADLGTARDVVLMALVVGIWQIGNALTGKTLTGTADLAFPAPAYAARFATKAPSVRFGQPCNQLVFDASVLDLPLAFADPVARQLAVAQCERSLDALGESGRLIARVRELVYAQDRGFRSLEDVASALRVSSRTLKRRLSLQGVTYSDLLEVKRREVALLLLRSPSLSLDEVAEQLGYSDVANFSRAFRRWTGVAPGAYRRGG